MNGPEAVLELWQGLVAGFPDLHTDDAVFVVVVFSGTLGEDLGWLAERLGHPVPAPPPGAGPFP